MSELYVVKLKLMFKLFGFSFSDKILNDFRVGLFVKEKALENFYRCKPTCSGIVGVLNLDDKFRGMVGAFELFLINFECVESFFSRYLHLVSIDLLDDFDIWVFNSFRVSFEVVDD